MLHQTILLAAVKTPATHSPAVQQSVSVGQVSVPIALVAVALGLWSLSAGHRWLTIVCALTFAVAVPGAATTVAGIFSNVLTGIGNAFSSAAA